MLDKAIGLAVDSHRGQKDLNGEPYILHPLRVMLLVPAEEVYRVAAVLHDVIEDTVSAPSEVHHDMWLTILKVEGFSSEVIDAVDALTRRGKDNIGESYWDYIKRCMKNPVARVVKVADILDNSGPDRRVSSGMLKRYKKALEILQVQTDFDINFSSAQQVVSQYAIKQKHLLRDEIEG